MATLSIILLATQGTPAYLFEQANSRIEKLIAPANYTLVDNSPDILFFLTGGSEQYAIKQVSAGSFYLLIGSKHDNSYASAAEVKAYLNDLKIPSLLLDEEEEDASSILNNYYRVKSALNNLNGKKLGLIGKVSDWLIASSVPHELLKARFGIKLVEIPWHELPHFSEFKPSNSLLELFSDEQQSDLTDTARVYELLEGTIQNRGLDAITVECFPIVKNDGVTACLPLAKFNNEGYPAGCEGDLTAIAGMMFCKELTGIIPWIANINKANHEGCLFSHCTIAPGLVNGFSIRTHFETGMGTAIQGDFKEDVVTVFRFDKNLEKAFVANAQVTARPKSETACRTQIEVRFNNGVAKLLRTNPLGNHHLILPGNHKELLQFACQLKGIKIQIENP